MKQEQAEQRAETLNRLVRHPALSYRPCEVPPTKWEAKRWAVMQQYDGKDVGIAAL